MKNSFSYFFKDLLFVAFESAVKLTELKTNQLHAKLEQTSLIVRKQNSIRKPKTIQSVDCIFFEENMAKA